MSSSKPNTIILGVRPSTQEFWGDTIIQPITSPQQRVIRSKTLIAPSLRGAAGERRGSARTRWDAERPALSPDSATCFKTDMNVISTFRVIKRVKLGLAPSLSSPHTHTVWNRQPPFPTAQGQTSVGSSAPRSLLLLLQRPNLKKLVCCLRGRDLQRVRVPTPALGGPELGVTTCSALIVLPPGECVWRHNT